MHTIIVTVITTTVITVFTHQNMQGSLLYILPMPNNTVVKLFTIYNILHNIFIEKEKYYM